jgi:Cu/Ag efflux pump CusA
VLIGGLVSSTVLVLTLFPVLYLFVDGTTNWTGRQVRRLVRRA